ncbi:hypothetical protein IKM56_02200 [Candidatus Saccharibacteria bacterium]|jgi:hypothetical protein|nr:hypothetical protein [Candidatus Saccharibacteria bacterium]
MESDAFFHIPMNSRSDSFGSSTTAVVDAVEITSAPTVEIKTNNESKMADTLSLYDELSAISEEVIACRNAALNKA